MRQHYHRHFNKTKDEHGTVDLQHRRGACGRGFLGVATTRRQSEHDAGTAPHRPLQRRAAAGGAEVKMTPHYRSVAMTLLLVGGLAQFAWRHVDPEAQADVWNASQALLVLLLLALTVNAYRSAWVTAAAALLGCWQMLTAGCSMAWLWKPWTVHPGQEQCSAALNVPLGAVGAWLLLLLAAGLGMENSRRGGP